MTKELPDVRLTLNLCGREKTRIIGPSRKRRIEYHGKNLFCQAAAVLKNEGDGMISPGSYSYPFEFLLPESIPSSADGGKNEDMFAIQYKLTLSASTKQRQINNLIKHYFLVTSKPLPNVRVPSHIEPKMLPIGTFGIGKGKLAFAAHVDDTHVGRGTEVVIRLAAQNMSTTTDIERVEIALEENATWMAKNRRSYANRVVTSLNDVDLPGIVREKRTTTAAADADYVLSKLRTDVALDDNIVILDVPKSCKDTYGGSLISISHELKITLYTKNLVSNPTVTIPLKIGSPSTEVQQ